MQNFLYVATLFASIVFFAPGSSSLVTHDPPQASLREHSSQSVLTVPGCGDKLVGSDCITVIAESRGIELEPFHQPTYVPHIPARLGPLFSTIITTALNAQQNPETVVVFSFTLPSGKPSVIPSLAKTVPSASIPKSSAGAIVPQSSITSTSDVSSPYETTLLTDSVTTPYSKITFSTAATQAPKNKKRGGHDGVSVRRCIPPFCSPGHPGTGPGFGSNSKDTGNGNQLSDFNDGEYSESQRPMFNSTSSSTSSPKNLAFFEPCSLSCSTCNVPPSKSRIPRRDLSKHLTDIWKNNPSKRVLTTPEAYGGNVSKFVLAEYKSAGTAKLDTRGTRPGSHSTAFGWVLKNRRFNVAVGGLHGCTSVLVASHQAVWLSHFWEYPSFRVTFLTYLNTLRHGTPGTAQDFIKFEQDVINRMQYGDGTAEMPGLFQHTGVSGKFHSTQKPISIIVTPRTKNGIPGELRYDMEVKRIQQVLQNLFPDAPSIVVDYISQKNVDVRKETAAGKVLFQYDPAQVFTVSPHNSCEAHQEAMWRVWFEDHPDPIWTESWAAQANQLIPDNPACPIPHGASSTIPGLTALVAPPTIPAPTPIPLESATDS